MCVVVLATGCFALTQHAAGEPLLACVAMGLFAVNPRETRRTEARRPPLRRCKSCES